MKTILPLPWDKPLLPQQVSLDLHQSLFWHRNEENKKREERKNKDRILINSHVAAVLSLSYSTSPIPPLPSSPSHPSPTMAFLPQHSMPSAAACMGHHYHLQWCFSNGCQHRSVNSVMKMSVLFTIFTIHAFYNITNPVRIGL